MKAFLLLFALISDPAFATGRSFVHTVEYEVPAPESLQAFSRFEITYRASESDRDTTEISYTLPATLVGQPREFKLAGHVDEQAPAFELHGENADMKCVTNDGSVLCRVVHHNVKVDLLAVKAALDETNFTPAEKQGHLDLASFAAREGGDLVGVMTYAQGLHY